LAQAAPPVHRDWAEPPRYCARAAMPARIAQREHPGSDGPAPQFVTASV
jgi:hypothetical protein